MLWKRSGNLEYFRTYLFDCALQCLQLDCIGVLLFASLGKLIAYRILFFLKISDSFLKLGEASFLLHSETSVGFECYILQRES